MVFCNIVVFLIACFLISKEQELNIEQAVDNQTVMFFFAQVSPSLNEATFFLIAFNQLICSFQGCFSSLSISIYLIFSHTRRCVQETEIMVIQLYSLIDTLQERKNIFMCHVFKCILLTVFISQPQFSRPETIGPFCVTHDWIDIIKGSWCREIFLEIVKVEF